MFDNFGTVIVQAVGFFTVFVFFVYQLLLEDKKTTNNKFKSPRKKVTEIKNINDKQKKKGFFKHLFKN